MQRISIAVLVIVITSLAIVHISTSITLSSNDEIIIRFLSSIFNQFQQALAATGV